MPVLSQMCCAAVSYSGVQVAMVVLATLAPMGAHSRVLCRLVLRAADASLAASLAAPALLTELSRWVPAPDKVFSAAAAHLLLLQTTAGRDLLL